LDAPKFSKNLIQLKNPPIFPPKIPQKKSTIMQFPIIKSNEKFHQIPNHQQRKTGVQISTFKISQQTNRPKKSAGIRDTPPSSKSNLNFQ
jgi:hypothetical protein